MVENYFVYLDLFIFFVVVVVVVVRSFSLLAHGFALISEWAPVCLDFCVFWSVFALNCCDIHRSSSVFLFIQVKINMELSSLAVYFFFCSFFFFIRVVPLKPYKCVCVHLPNEIHFSVCQEHLDAYHSLSNIAFIKGFNYCALNHFVYLTSTRRL